MPSGDPSSWSVPVSKSAQSTLNPIRRLTDTKTVTNPAKEMISLSIGDPLAYGNLATHPYVIDCLKKNAEIPSKSGYAPSMGYETSRQAVAQYCNVESTSLTARDVILASGASGALELAMCVLLNPGDNILLPRPGFSLYNTIAGCKGFQVKYYDLCADKNWEANIEHMRSLVDNKTRAILVNNPSNPCGSVYSATHLQEILAVAEEFKVPIISDEIYADMTFKGHKFFPIASLTRTVPVLAIGGLAKRFLLPGWRLGWILVHDHGSEALAGVRAGLVALSQLILGPNSLVQSILPDILQNTPSSFFDETMHTLETHARFMHERIAKIPGLTPVEAQGAMYQMIGIQLDKFKEIHDDVDFMRKLLAEESVFVLPGQVFEYPAFFRVVLCAPLPKLQEACDRLAAFCARHASSALPQN
eukprot:TRINITY_DN2595_c0_g2_i2.p1 TRINITY_DN2595_c0_g2~~TRINITY_DN2595_c0_g2_i2.p1  ORF type:complete len:466 (+),score=92.19 TRINITY_DN2595_c0_g2_i2:148-1398(+)